MFSVIKVLGTVLRCFSTLHWMNDSLLSNSPWPNTEFKYYGMSAYLQKDNKYYKFWLNVENSSTSNCTGLILNFAHGCRQWGRPHLLQEFRNRHDQMVNRTIDQITQDFASLHLSSLISLVKLLAISFTVSSSLTILTNSRAISKRTRVLPAPGGPVTMGMDGNRHERFVGALNYKMRERERHTH